MAVSLTLNSELKTTRKGTTLLKLSVVGFGMSSKVFAIEVMPRSADKTAQNVRFSHVCSPSELVEFPEDEPGDCHYFRVDCIEMVFDTPDIVDHVMDNMRHDVKKLVDEYKELETLKPVTDSVTYDSDPNMGA